MTIVVVVLLLALLFGGLGYFANILWLVALVLALFWLAGFAFRSGTGTRWYRW